MHEFSNSEIPIFIYCRSQAYERGNSLESDKSQGISQRAVNVNTKHVTWKKQKIFYSNVQFLGV